MNYIDECKLNQAFNICGAFEKDYARSCQYNRTYAQLMRKIMEEQPVNDNGVMVFLDNKFSFEDITGLGRSTYFRIMREDNYIPSLATFMTLCMIYDLDLSMAQALRETLGLAFCQTNRLHQAYCFLLVNCRGKSISYCNMTLKKLGIDEKYFLGDRTIDEFALMDELQPS